MPKGNIRVLIIVGSESDLSTMKECAAVLDDFQVPYQLTVASAHRSPERAMRLAKEAASRGARVVICAAGLAAHLAGSVAAHTSLPVIGVPMAAGPLKGLDSLLSTVQMPPGVPVATVAIGEAGAKNAAHLAVRILAAFDPALARRLKTHVAAMARKVEKAARELEKG